MKNDVMLDLETLGTSARAVVTAIAAVRFDAQGVALKDTFYVRLQVREQLKQGREIDPETVAWWLEQTDEAARELWAKPRMPLGAALAAFTDWLGGDAREVRLWGNGAAFDNAILADCYRMVGAKQPWRFSNDRCYRTAKAGFEDIAVRTGTHHHALDDAISQARHLGKIWRHR